LLAALPADVRESTKSQIGEMVQRFDDTGTAAAYLLISEALR
jgi:hypothetical protein